VIRLPWKRNALTACGAFRGTLLPMPIEYHPAPEQFRGKGVVFLAFDDGEYSGYWELEPDGPPTALEECPRSISPVDAISWGRQRTPRLLIRPESDPGRYYLLGRGRRTVWTIWRVAHLVRGLGKSLSAGTSIRRSERAWLQQLGDRPSTHLLRPGQQRAQRVHVQEQGAGREEDDS
jgi:hypothetical protein